MYLDLSFPIDRSPEHAFGFLDNDGCGCFLAYTTIPSLHACYETRRVHCDGLWTQPLLAYLSLLHVHE
jgi:hypothetical protein